ncbi:MAG: hypothetical protein JW983_00790 [Elusimicrobia bacterium]|nr:hypothetical protein [Elusimicrobiota bacterium]
MKKLYLTILLSVICHLSSAICLNAGMLVVADFENGADPLTVDPDSNTSSTDVSVVTGTYVAHVDSMSAHGNVGYCLKIVHLNTNTGWFRLEFDDTYANIISTYNESGTYKSLSFWVRGENGGETFEINLRADGGVESDWRPHITHFLPGGITTSWQKVVVPVETLVQGYSPTNAQKVDGVIFNFRNLCPAATIYIDDVIFHTALAPVYVDTFEDGSAPNAWNSSHGNYVDGGTSSGAFTNMYVSTQSYPSDSGGYSLQVIWSTGNSAGVTDSAAFISGIIERADYGIDMSKCDTISCEVKADADGVGQILGLGLYADPGDGEEKIVVSTTVLTTSWQSVTRTFSTDLPTITNTDICDFELWVCNQDPARGGVFQSTAGFTFYVDNICFKDTNSPTIPGSFKDDGNTITDNHAFGAVNVLTVTADAVGTDATIESIRFEHDNMTSGATWYVIAIDTDTSDSTYTATWDISGLTSGSTYRIRAIAMDIAGNESSLTYTGCSLDNVSPSDINDLSAAAGTNDGEIDIKWTSPGDDADSGALTGKYKVEYSSDSSYVSWSTTTAQIDISTSGVTPSSEQSYTISGLVHTTTYYIKIWTADESANWSNASSTASALAVGQVIISTSGGTVYYKDGVTNVFIPLGAIDSDITITITAPDINDTSAVPNATLPATRTRPLSAYEFGPVNTVFKKPVSLTLLYPETAGVDETTLKIFWWDGFAWRYIGGSVDSTNNTVSVEVRHFSKYAVLPAGALSASDYRPKRKIITPFLVDGWNDYIQFDGLSGNFTIRIYDITGRKVRTIRDVPIWEGYDDDGNIVESGVYIYQFKVGGELISGTVTVAK